MYELGEKNSCQEFLAYTLEKALKDMKSKLGEYKGGNWKLGYTQTTRYSHSPLTEVPILNRLFTYSHPYPGSKRTPNVAITWGNTKPNLENVVLGGSVFRMISDLSDEGQI